VSSIFIFSELQQNITAAQVGSFVQVKFEKFTIPTGSGLTPIGTAPNIVGTLIDADGYYLVSYKIDVRAGSGDLPSTSTRTATCLTIDGVFVEGSTTLVESPESNHIYTVPNTVGVVLMAGQQLSLYFWTSDRNAHIGEPGAITGRLPAIPPALLGVIPTEATASMVVTRLVAY
jgi:hypothetical protein